MSPAQAAYEQMCRTTGIVWQVGPKGQRMAGAVTWDDLPPEYRARWALIARAAIEAQQAESLQHAIDADAVRRRLEKAAPVVIVHKPIETR